MSIQDFNFDWLFSLDDGDSHAQLPAYNDADWRPVQLPHDWSIEFPFDQEKGDGATGYLPGGVGWYRKRFKVAHDDGQLAFILFDGVYNNSEVWCNGQKLGENPYGYAPFWFDLTPYLNPDSDEQMLAVKVDHSRYVDSRWYTGSGIYRGVKLITKSRLHIPIWGTRVTTPEISPNVAHVNLDVTLSNHLDKSSKTTVRTEFVDPNGQTVAIAESKIKLPPQSDTVCTQTAALLAPELWDLDNPKLYKAVTTLRKGKKGKLHERYETPFGIRTCEFDAKKGFFLNGRNTLIKGVCLHHDAGLVGAAVPDGVWRRRFAILKEMGCNAIRIAHNPSSEALLNLCDEMGFLVQVEFFDEWENPKDKRLNKNDTHDDYLSRSYTEHFAEWAEIDLKRVMLRDRNHPCVFQWSIGNEVEWTFPRYERATGYFDADSNGNYFWTPPPYSPDEIRARFEQLPEDGVVLAETAARLAKWTREMDKTRPVVANCILPSASMVSGYADPLDIVGYSYRQVIYDGSHAAFPNKVIMGTENLGQWHEWQHVIDRPFISGIFIWTGIHYMGECHGKWPQRGLPCGMLDFAGFERGSALMYKTLWRDDPQIHLATQNLEKSPYVIDDLGDVVEKEPGAWKQALWFWHDVNFHWNYAVDDPIAVEVYSNCAEVELFLNGISFGRQHLADQEDRIFKWMVPFANGRLEARGWHSNGQRTDTILQSAAEPAAVQLMSDRASLTADGYDVAHLIAQLVDAQGVPVKHIERKITFEVTGDCKILGVDNGHYQSVQPYQTNRVTTSQGRALLIIQAGRSAADVSIRAVSVDLMSSLVPISIKNSSQL